MFDRENNLLEETQTSFALVMLLTNILILFVLCGTIRLFFVLTEQTGMLDLFLRDSAFFR